MSIKKQNDKAFGPGTVVKNGISYPNSYWAELGVVPAKNPDYKPGSKASEWIHPDRLMARQKTSKAVKVGLNDISDKAKYMKSGYNDGILAYDVVNSAYNPFTGKMVKTGNAFGRFGAGIKGALIGAGKADFKKLLRKVLDEHNPDETRISDILKEHAKPGSYIPSKNPKDVASPEYIEKLFEEKIYKKKGKLLDNVAKALGKVATKSGRASIRASIAGTAEGIALGIISSDIGMAAYNAGKRAVESVKNGVANALDHIVALFDKNKAAELKKKANTFQPKVVTIT